MLTIEFDPKAGIAILHPQDALTEADFAELSSIIDPHLEQEGEFRGLIIHTRDFPGWESFSAMLEHFKFVRGYHKKLAHVALVTDSSLVNLAEKLASHFVAAELRHFPYDELEEAKIWILSTPGNDGFEND